MVLVKNPSPSRGENLQKDNAKKDNKKRSRASRGNSPADQATSRRNSPGKSNNSSVKVVTKSSLQQSRGSE